MLFAVIFFVMSATTASAQNVIKWRATAKMTTQTEGMLTVKAIVSPGWHLYGTNLPEGGPKPTVFDFKGSKGIRFIGDFKPSVSPKKVHDELFGLDLTWWDATVSFTRKFKLTGAKDDAVISGQITYMACNDENCMPPRTETFKISVR